MRETVTVVTVFLLIDRGFHPLVRVIHMSFEVAAERQRRCRPASFAVAVALPAVVVGRITVSACLSAGVSAVAPAAVVAPGLSAVLLLLLISSVCGSS
jgi:hypothetical protein